MTLQVTQAAIQEILRLHHQYQSRRADADDSAAQSSSRVLTTDEPSEPVQTQLDFVMGGCAEQRYQLNFDNVSKEASLIHCGAVALHVSPTAWPHVQQLTVDYVEDLMGGSFRFDNPGLLQTCSCGQSFRL